jgi:hypothetical protein
MATLHLIIADPSMQRLQLESRKVVALGLISTDLVAHLINNRVYPHQKLIREK